MIIRKLLILLLFFVMAAPVLAASGTTYGACDSPLGNYRCYDKTETSYCPGQGLTYVPGWCPLGNDVQCCAPPDTPRGPRVGGEGFPYVGYCDQPLGSYKCYDISKHQCTDGLQYVRGWCLGGNNIQCCAPPGTPIGKRVYGPGIEIKLPENVQVQDFQFFLDGTGSCEYNVKSNGIETVRKKVACGSWVTITVGPNGDCRDEGENICTVTNSETEKTFSITFYRPEKTYGACKKYTGSNCIDENECKATGGTPLRSYCLNAPNGNIKCCIYQATYISESGSFIYDATGTVSSLSSIDNQLNLLSQKYDAKIIIELVNEIPPDAEKNLLNKFDFKYKLHESGKKLTMIILYGKAKNQWRVLRGSENCGIEEDTIRKIISDESVSKKAEVGSYDEAFGNLVKLLEAVIAKKSEKGDICQESFNVKDCKRECESSLFGCSLETCVNMDGCMWNNNNCENICPGERATEVVVVKKGEKCNGLDCNDVYLCRNGLPENPIKAAFSKASVDKAGISASCDGVPQSFVEKYNAYKDLIGSKISKYGLNLADNPQALVAAIISKESAWKENAQSSSSTGIMQINVPAHPECDVQKIREYDVDANIDCGVQFLSNLAKTQSDDVGRKLYDCKDKAYGTIAEVVLRYYNGWPSRCLNDPSREDENFVEDIMDQRDNPKYTANYPRWKACLEQQPTNEETSGNILVLPEGKLEVSEKVKMGQDASKCSLDANIVQGYWIGLNDNEKTLQCAGMHGTGKTCPEVNTQKVGQLFSSIAVGTKVTVKNPYQVAASSVSNPITGQAVAVTGYAAGDFQTTCSSVCSGVLGGISNLISSAGCQNLCNQKGCYWENNKCTSAPSLCVIEELVQVKETTTIPQRLGEVKNGNLDFIRGDPICLGVNCGGYLMRIHDYIFGAGKHFITGVGGNAWDYPKNIENRGGTVRWFNWKNGETFNNYDSMKPGDIIGFHNTESSFNALPFGWIDGNTPSIDFTHVALYLGKKGNEHMITHLYHAGNEDPVRLESLESFLRRFPNFKIRVLMSPDQERLYRVLDGNYRTVLTGHKIAQSENLQDLISNSRSKEELMWLTAYINSLTATNPNLDKYIGKVIKIPKSLPQSYAYQYIGRDIELAYSEENADLVFWDV